MNFQIEGIQTSPGENFNEVYVKLEAGQRLIDQIRSIDTALSQMENCRELRISSVNNSRLQIAIDTEDIKAFLLSFMGARREKLVKEFNERFK